MLLLLLPVLSEVAILLLLLVAVLCSHYHHQSHEFRCRKPIYPTAAWGEKLLTVYPVRPRTTRLPL